MSNKRHERDGLTVVGYWYSEYEPEYPKPEKVEWDEEERILVIAYLTVGGEFYGRFRGFSTCRVCGCRNGSAEFSDGTYVWPEGLVHYVERHSVGLPREFVDHAVKRARELAVQGGSDGN